MEKINTPKKLDVSLVNVDSFWSKVARGPKNECWLWEGTRHTADHYGQFQVGSRRVLAHRVAYQLVHGPTNKQVCHACDVTLCCNPSHLFEGSQGDNILDMVQKGRGSTQKLTPVEVKCIRILVENKISKTAIGKIFAISKSTIQHIIKGRSWKWL